MITEDRRKFLRVSTSKQITFAAGNRICEGSILNSSEGGIFIKTMDQLLEGQNISLNIESHIFGREKRTARISRVTLHDIGVKYHNTGYNR